eukprot:XP_017950499.1 PREDICTED: uncharacterized protein LOC100488259 [Xenopus tropicalis]
MKFGMFGCCLLLLHFLNTIQGGSGDKYMTGIVNQSIRFPPVPFKYMADWYFNGQYRDADNGALVLSSDGKQQDYVPEKYKNRVKPEYNASLDLRDLKKEDEGWYKLVYDGDSISIYLTVLGKGEENITGKVKGLAIFPSMPCRYSGRLLYHGADIHNKNPMEVLHCDDKTSPGHVADTYQSRLRPSCKGSSELTNLQEEDGGHYTWECDGTVVHDIHLVVKGKSSLHPV